MKLLDQLTQGQPVTVTILSIGDSFTDNYEKRKRKCEFSLNNSVYEVYVNDNDMNKWLFIQGEGQVSAVKDMFKGNAYVQFAPTDDISVQSQNVPETPPPPQDQGGQDAPRVDEKGIQICLQGYAQAWLIGSMSITGFDTAVPMAVIIRSALDFAEKAREETIRRAKAIANPVVEPPLEIPVVSEIKAEDLPF